MAKVKAENKTGVRVELAESPLGILMPMVVLSFDQSMPYRLCKVAALRLAATIEELSLVEEWCVTVGQVNWQGGKLPQLVHVSLELSTGSQDEANRGITVLGRAVSAALKK